MSKNVHLNAVHSLGADRAGTRNRKPIGATREGSRPACPVALIPLAPP